MAILASNSKNLHKSSTVVLSALLFVITLLEILQPHVEILAPLMLPPGTYPYVSAGISVAIGVGRYISQQCLQVKKEEEDASNESAA
ncbi:hypothetical protein D3C87_1556470 [compost metagenome]